MGRYAICVGIDDYDNLPEGWDSLEFASADAQAMAEILSTPTLGAFDRVELLTKPAQTTLSGIIDALKSLFYDVRLEPDDTVLLYFACHAGMDAQDRLYLIPSDGKINQWGVPDMGTMLRIESLGAYFATSHAHNLVLTLDLAYGDDPVTLAKRIKLLENPNFSIAGAVVGQKVIDELHTLRHSPLSFCLFKALKQMPSPDGWVHLNDVQNYLSTELRKLLGPYWATHCQLLNENSPFLEDVVLLRSVPESEEFTREVKLMLQRAGYRLHQTSLLNPQPGRLRAEISAAFTRSVVEVLAVDNSRVQWTAHQATSFLEKVDKLRQLGEITHGLVITRTNLLPELAQSLQRWHLDCLTLEDAIAQA